MAKPTILAKLANFFGVDGSGNILSNPATPKIMTIGASVASNALTVTLAPCTIDFRSATLTSGAVNTRTVAATLSLVVPSTATLGTVSAVQNKQVVLAIDNAGTVELAIVNISGGNALDETGVISTTAISGAATSASVIYSTTARTNVAYRVVGYVESTQATAGTWATAPSTIQGMGGQALSVMGSVGYGQALQNLTGSRLLSTTYYNTTGRAICVHVEATIASGGNKLNLNYDGQNIPGSLSSASGTSVVFGIVQPGKSYSVVPTASATLETWRELR